MKAGDEKTFLSSPEQEDKRLHYKEVFIPYSVLVLSTKTSKGHSCKNVIIQNFNKIGLNDIYLQAAATAFSLMVTVILW